MKKRYIKPQLLEVSINTSNLICASLPKGGKTSGGITTADGRYIEFDDFDDEDDEDEDW